jgi:hypothetical protein
MVPKKMFSVICMFILIKNVGCQHILYGSYINGSEWDKNRIFRTFISPDLKEIKVVTWNNWISKYFNSNLVNTFLSWKILRPIIIFL